MAKRFSAILLAGALLVGMALPVFAEDQPHMQAALEALQNAERELQKAEHDKGGHREQALQQVRAAIAQVKAGMHYDEKHEKNEHH
jgi:hypothetical protein